jgi:hypothetical protein
MGVEFQSNVSWGGSPHGSGNGGSDVSGLDFLNNYPDQSPSASDDTSGSPSASDDTSGSSSGSDDVSGLDFLDPVQEDLITEADKWDWLNELQDTWEGSGSNPLYPYNENYPPLGISSPYAMQGMAFDPYSGQWYATQGGDISPAWQGATKGAPGAVLIDGEWKKPILSGLGSHFMESDDLWSGGNPDLSDPAVLENIQDIQQDYYSNIHPSSQPDTGESGYGYGYDYDPGSYTVSGGYGYGYGGDPNQIGKTPFDYGDPYSEARFAPLEQHERMVDVNTPRYAARGGIMNLRR